MQTYLIVIACIVGHSLLVGICGALPKKLELHDIDDVGWWFPSVLVPIPAIIIVVTWYKMTKPKAVALPRAKVEK